MNIITENCSGCRACEMVCPKNCISMKEDNEGFLVAQIDNESCIKCGLCQAKCPQNIDIKNNNSQSVYALRIKDEELLKKSASGGAFAVLAEYILQNNGIVFGAAYNDVLEVKHISINDKKDLYRLQSSKYVQSDTGITFKECKEYLESGKQVLYSGTPCQIAGLKAYLGKNYQNLLTIDLICHGVGSPLLFKRYLEWLKEKIGEKIIFYNFRDKSKGWGLTYTIIFRTRTRTRTRTANLDPYYRAFLKGAVYRECCYKCSYAKPNRVGDITIGDYWGIEKEHPQFFDKKGVSAVFINSKNGKKYFDKIHEKIVYIKSDIEKVARRNENLNHPSERGELRNYIYADIYKLSGKEFIEKNLKCMMPKKIDYIKAIVPDSVKRIIRLVWKKGK